MQVSKIKSFVDWLVEFRPSLKEIVFGHNKFERKPMTNREWKEAQVKELNTNQKQQYYKWSKINK